MSKPKHSVKVPQIYKTASRIVKTVKESGGSVKDLVYTCNKHLNIKGLYALIIKALQLEDLINQLLNKVNILTKESKADPWLIRILITELLFGKQHLPGESKPVQTVLAYQQQLLAELNALEKEKDLQLNLIQNKVNLPRFVRVNTLMITVKDAVSHFCKEGWRKLHLKADKYEDFLKAVEDIPEDAFLQDFHVDDLLVFPKATEFHEHELYQNGSIILQDKASCLASWLLKPPPGSTVLDMCAAPGMKTTHLAALMKNKGKIYAVERNEKRYKTLCEQVEKYGTSCVQTLNMDALSVDAKRCPDVQYILVDPSCSGSGIIDRPAPQSEEACDAARLNKLAGFQILLLRHALSNFPSVKRVVYSTCSIKQEENEQVVERVLQYINTDPAKPIFQLDSTQLQERWLNHGSSEYEFSDSCFYALPKVDFTNGFFIAVFKKVDTDDESKPKSVKRRRHKKKHQETAAAENEKSGNNEHESVVMDSVTEQLDEKLENKEIINATENVGDNNLLVPHKKKKRKMTQHNESNSDENQENTSVADVRDIDSNKKRKFNINDMQNETNENTPHKEKPKKKRKQKNDKCYSEPDEPVDTLLLEKNEYFEQSASTESQTNAESVVLHLKDKPKKHKRHSIGQTENIDTKITTAVELEEDELDPIENAKLHSLKKKKKAKIHTGDEKGTNSLTNSQESMECSRTLDDQPLPKRRKKHEQISGKLKGDGLPEVINNEDSEKVVKKRKAIKK